MALIEGKRIKELPETSTLNDTDDFVVEDKVPQTKRSKLQALYDWIFKKLPIVNNFTTNQAGFLADARALKALKDQIDVLNTKPTMEYNESTSATLYRWDNGFQIVRFQVSELSNSDALGAYKYFAFPRNFVNNRYTVLATPSTKGSKPYVDTVEANRVLIREESAIQKPWMYVLAVGMWK